MKLICARSLWVAATVVVFASLTTADGSASGFPGANSPAPTSAMPETTEPPAAGAPQIQPKELVSILKSAKGPKPLIIQVGFRVMYLQAHIPGSEYIGPAFKADGILKLRRRVEALARTRPIVLYCGCCPWDKCPNIKPSYKLLRDMGFKDVKLLYIAHNFGTDWVEKSYPTARGD